MRASVLPASPTVPAGLTRSPRIAREEVEWDVDFLWEGLVPKPVVLGRNSVVGLAPVVDGVRNDVVVYELRRVGDYLALGIGEPGVFAQKADNVIMKLDVHGGSVAIRSVNINLAPLGSAHESSPSAG